jgi:hypothetical protein
MDTEPITAGHPGLGQPSQIGGPLDDQAPALVSGGGVVTVYPDVASSGDKEAKAKVRRVESREVAVAFGPSA